ncbi:MAG TPA: hypothetical protein VGR57_09035 [Ktedonobacterales bacterium]|nr:hypothetical protein [Ktedonobacterales bacterium]
MQRVIARPIVRIGLLILAALIVIGGLGAYTQATAFSYADLIAALRARGAEVRESGAASTLTFQGAGHALLVNGAQVTAYAYGTTLAAQYDASRVSSDGSTFRGGVGPFGGSAVSVDWIAPPHHYHRGRVIVTYIGDDRAITTLLTAVLGPQFAGGAVPSGTGAFWLMDRLRVAGATVEVTRHRPGSSVIHGTQPTVDEYDLLVDGSLIAAYTFADATAAATYAAHIRDGEYASAMCDCFAPPHFYRSGQLIVAFGGKDARILQLLAAVLGPPFYEGHF